MVIGNKSGRLFLAALAVTSVLVAPGNEAFASSALELDPAHIPWSRLVFQAASGIASAETEVRLAPVSAVRLKSSLLTVANEPSPSLPEADALMLSVVTNASSKLPLMRDKTWDTQVWFRPGNASALQRTRLKTGNDPDAKTFRHLPNGVQRVRAEPKNSDEAKRPPDAWSKTRSTFHPYGPARADCPQVLDPAALFYVLSAIEMSQGDPPLTLCVFNKKALYQVDIHAAGSERMPVSYTQRRGATEERVETETEVLTIAISSRPLEPVAQKPEPFEFFEMRGDVQISFDPASRLPVQVRGTVKNIGETTFRLSESDLTR